MYIRTKNRIYKVESTLRDNGFVKGYNVGEMAFIRKDQVIKQAETIEELCDMFVVIENVYGKIYHSINYTLCDDLRNDKDNEGIYGAIWTDKGLIYVAKMNESGDLELI